MDETTAYDVANDIAAREIERARELADLYERANNGDLRFEEVDSRRFDVDDERGQDLRVLLDAVLGKGWEK